MLAPHPLALPPRMGFGVWLAGFHAQLVADTPAMREYRRRPFERAAVMAPGRMIDKAGEMLQIWRANDTSGEDRARSELPVMVVAFGRDVIPLSPDAGRPVAVAAPVAIPGDPLGRMFRLRTVTVEVRAQVVIAAADVLTANSIAMQLHLYASAHRTCRARYMLAGMVKEWPVPFETPDIMSVAVPTDVNNLTVLAADFTMRPTIPLLSHPDADDDDADGLGSGDMLDPHGYLMLQQVDGTARSDQGHLLSQWSVSGADQPVSEPPA